MSPGILAASMELPCQFGCTPSVLKREGRFQKRLKLFMKFMLGVEQVGQQPGIEAEKNIVKCKRAFSSFLADHKALSVLNDIIVSFDFQQE